MLSLQLHSMLNRVTIHCPTLWTREWYQLISTFKSNLGSLTTMLEINMGCKHTQPSLYQLWNSHIPQRILSHHSIASLNALPISRLYICTGVLDPRAIYYLQIQLCKSLQPLGLMLIQVWLCLQVSKWFMVGVYCTFMPMEVLPPLHTRLING